MRQTRRDPSDSLPQYPDLASYPNPHRGHTLKLDQRTAIGFCSCGQWQAENFPERQLVRSHQYHVFNLPNA